MRCAHVKDALDPLRWLRRMKTAIASTRLQNSRAHAIFPSLNLGY